MFYQCRLFSLIYIGTIFNRPIHINFNELVSLHAYLDDLIMCIKGLIITSTFQVLGPFQISFVLDTSSAILRDLQRQLFYYITNSPHLRYCEGPA
jgi:hypothetical protein